MKRPLRLMVVISLVLIFVLTGCEGNRENPQIEKMEYKDGTYTGYSNAGDHGYAWAKIKVKSDDITDVQLMEITSKGNEKDYETYEYEPSVKAYQKMPERFEEADSADVDVYTGATHSSEKFKEAVKRALDYARGGLEGKYYEGKFQGSSERTKYGYAIALVTIEEDHISDVELKEVDEAGEWIDFSNYKYEPAVEANEEMAERFVEANSPNVDMYTGATQSSIRYKEAVTRALEHARKNPEEEIE